MTAVIVAADASCSFAQPTIADDAPRGPRTPHDERQSFRLADADLDVPLAAAEPDIASPVAIAWDANGAMFVAEMRGYPVTKGLGRIRRLQNLDGDGVYETSTVFADGLSFPGSVMPYREGILVTAAPDLCLLTHQRPRFVHATSDGTWT